MRLKKFKKNRDKKNIINNLNALKKGLDNDSNLLPLIIDCVRNHCTLGEICNVMKEVHGEHI